MCIVDADIFDLFRKNKTFDLVDIQHKKKC